MWIWPPGLLTEHEVRDNSVEGGFQVMQGLSGGSSASITHAEGAEVLGGAGDDVAAQNEDDAA
jgi:hypothetical protein